MRYRSTPTGRVAVILVEARLELIVRKGSRDAIPDILRGDLLEDSTASKDLAAVDEGCVENRSIEVKIRRQLF